MQQRRRAWMASVAEIQELLQQHLQPSVVSYNGSISACVRGRNWQLAISSLDSGCDLSFEFGRGLSSCYQYSLAVPWQLTTVLTFG